MSKIVTSLESSFTLNRSQIVKEEEVPIEIIEYLERFSEGHVEQPESRSREKCFWVTDICTF